MKGSRIREDIKNKIRQVEYYRISIMANQRQSNSAEVVNPDWTKVYTFEKQTNTMVVSIRIPEYLQTQPPIYKELYLKYIDKRTKQFSILAVCYEELIIQKITDEKERKHLQALEETNFTLLRKKKYIRREMFVKQILKEK